MNIIALIIVTSSQIAMDICDEKISPLCALVFLFNIVQIFVFCEIDTKTCFVIFLRLVSVISSLVLIIFFWVDFIFCFNKIEPKSLMAIFITEIVFAHINLVAIAVFYVWKKRNLHETTNIEHPMISYQYQRIT
jgi:hypothetical protein